MNQCLRPTFTHILLAQNTLSSPSLSSNTYNSAAKALASFDLPHEMDIETRDPFSFFRSRTTSRGPQFDQNSDLVSFTQYLRSLYLENASIGSSNTNKQVPDLTSDYEELWLSILTAAIADLKSFQSAVKHDYFTPGDLLLDKIEFSKHWILSIYLPGFHDIVSEADCISYLEGLVGTAAKRATGHIRKGLEQYELKEAKPYELFEQYRSTPKAFNGAIARLLYAARVSYFQAIHSFYCSEEM